ncbi:hypothetical protein IAD21_03890 [Abditibacteriota bacterium]|nr:hypothetical protein IAD21_03890 [Abditibacteriota bacterium]
MSPSVSIVLPVWNGAGDLREMLPCIAAQQYEGQVEIVAIDSGSRDESVELLRQAGARVWEIPQHEFGHGKTRNFGVQQSQGDIIVFLSQDAQPVGTNWLYSLVNVLEDKSVGAMFARQLPRPHATALEQFFHAEIYPQKSRTVSPAKRTRELVFFSNVCSAARRDVCLRYPFDETLIMSEDQIFADTLLRNGLALVYAANVAVIHSHSYDLSTLFRRNFDSGYSLRGFDSMQMSLGHKLQRLARFWGSEVRFLVRAGSWAALAQMPVYEMTRVVAFLLGGQGARIPSALRRKMSLHRAFWDENASD